MSKKKCTKMNETKKISKLLTGILCLNDVILLSLKQFPWHKTYILHHQTCAILPIELQCHLQDNNPTQGKVD